MDVDDVYLQTSLLSQPERLYLRSVISVSINITPDFIGPPCFAGNAKIMKLCIRLLPSYFANYLFCN